MITYSIIKKSELEGLSRIDSEYYQPKYFRILDKLRDLKAVPISEVAKPIKRGFKPDNNLYFDYIEISEVNISTGAVNAVKVLGKEAPDRAQWIVKKGDVIISTVRPIRNAVAVITEHEDNFVCSSGFAVLKPIEVSHEFLFTYLKTKPIVELLDRKTTATMYPAVSWQDILSTPIFLPDNLTEKFIIQRVQEAIQNLKESDSLYLQAEQMLLEEMGLYNFDFSQPNFYTVPLSQAQKLNRVDAEHFQPKYDKIIKHLTKTGKTKLLGEIAPFINHGPQPPYFDDGDIPIITQRHMGRYLLNFESADEFTSQSFWSQRKKFQVQQNDVLFYSVGAYLGRTNIYLDDKKAMAGSYITIIRPDIKKRNPIYLAVYLNSLAGQMQSDRHSRASAQQYIYPKDIAQIIIYLPSGEFQTKIAELMIQSYEARKKAKSLLEKAKRKVEEAIESR